MVKVGVKKDAYDAIRSATVVAAGLNKLDKVIGTLEAGKLADVIVVDGDRAGRSRRDRAGQDDVPRRQADGMTMAASQTRLMQSLSRRDPVARTSLSQQDARRGRQAA